jgi:Tfp pilus assembly protein PilX
MSGINQQRLHDNQTGIGSLLFTMVMMIVISLIVLGFAQLSRRSVTETTNDLLSTQAYYAAESGINDADHAIVNGATYNTADTSSCTQFATDNSLNTTLNGSGTGYTCLNVNPTPSNLQVSLSPTSDAQVLSIDTIDSNNNAVAPGSLTLTWTPISGSSASLTTCPTTSLPASTSWNCPFDLLRFDLVPVDTVSRSALVSNTMAAFVLPSNGGAGSIAYSTANGQVTLGTANCTTAGLTPLCSLTITGLSAQKYAMRLTAIYGSSTTATITPANANDELANGQTIIDATGQAQDVLRRVEVRVPAGPSRNSNDNYAIESNGPICKHYGVGSNLDGSGLQYLDSPDTQAGCN